MDHRKSLIEKYPEIEKAPVTMETNIMWGHMDSANHVNNLIYLRWCETTRVLYFKKIGVDTSFEQEEGAILGWQDAKYIYPLTYPDEVLTTADVIEIREDRFVVECRVYSITKQKLACISKQEIVPYSYTLLKKIPLSETWISKIKSLQQG